ncbi:MULTISPECIES: MFS transporter [unclassified Bradyrhizobium]|uniref:MFS transporter n=1 Tax=unclassified Bradyrhizobium TaxID=2631580 RepID=UPI0024477ADB|nr:MULTISPECIES: MFS transporter [unclassified Bradyrhizobium]MDH2344069.1 MFS transporter [Bradyrhizobium sp. SSUT77]MDH2350338.1 MFS transporter [Bradyrhizobium sp. SSUT112]
MKAQIPDRKMAGVLLVLSITQVIGWGTIGLPAIIGRQLASDLHMNLPAVFAGTSVLYLAMGLCAPLLAGTFVRFGARHVMMAGTMVAAPGFIVLSISQEPVLYFSGWIILGVAGSAMLTTGAYIMLNEVAGQHAKNAIGALMLATGLSSSIFWPTTSALTALAGWRGTCLVYAAAMIVICLPLYAWCAPRRNRIVGEAVRSETQARVEPVTKGTFHLMVSAIALNAFMTFGLGAVLIELLKAEGLSSSEAIAFGSMLGLIQVSARAIDLMGRGRWDGITTGIVAAAVLTVAIMFLMIGEGSHRAIAAFVLLYGVGSGVLIVARATIPLVFYEKAEFARATSRIALPLNLASAIGPPVLVDVLTRFGSHGLLYLAVLCSFGMFLLMVLLGRRRPGIVERAADL